MPALIYPPLAPPCPQGGVRTRSQYDSYNYHSNQEHLNCENHYKPFKVRYPPFPSLRAGRGQGWVEKTPDLKNS